MIDEMVRRNISKTTKAECSHWWIATRIIIIIERAKRVEENTKRESREFNFPWRLQLWNFCFSPHRGESSSRAPFWKSCVACVQEVWRLCNWVVACPDPDECRVTSVPLIFRSSFVEMSITEGTITFHERFRGQPRKLLKSSVCVVTRAAWRALSKRMRHDEYRACWSWRI